MTSDQYVESVKQMMNQQNVFFTIFLAILAIILGFLGILQLKLSDKQIKSIKEETKSDLMRDLEDKLLKYEMKMKSIDLSKEVKEIVDSRNKFEHLLLDYEIVNMNNESNKLTRFEYLIGIYEDYLKRHIGNLNFFISKLSSKIAFGFRDNTIDINSEQIDIVIEMLKKIEENYNEKSVNLNELENQVIIYRNEKK